MHGLTGDFQTMPLQDLVVYLWNRQATGRLTLEVKATRKVLLLEHGQVINAASNLPREFLGQALINLGLVTDAQLQKALAAQKELKCLLGQSLVMTGALDLPTVETALATRFREAVLDAFNWAQGHFTFEADVRPSTPEGVPVAVPLIDVHKESELRVQAWGLIRQAFPSGDCTLSIVPQKVVDAPRPGSLDERIFAAIDAGQTIDEMALRLQTTDFFLYSRLHAYFQVGAVKVHAAAGPPLSVDLGLGDSPTAEQLLANARAFFTRGNFRDAWSLCRRSNELTPTLDAALLLRQVEAAWQPQLKADYLTTTRLLSLTISPEQLGRLNLTAPERYLLSRVDGKRDVESILRIAPVREFEALVALDRFVAQRWVKTG